ncbi:unnamed protein product [Pedinophyceae sp. YPF-701]|nr:unnamed protein product [Pedinophyceae sp. YPF-701]
MNDNWRLAQGRTTQANRLGIEKWALAEAERAAAQESNGKGAPSDDSTVDTRAQPAPSDSWRQATVQMTKMIPVVKSLQDEVARGRSQVALEDSKARPAALTIAEEGAGDSPRKIDKEDASWMTGMYECSGDPEVCKRAVFMPCSLVARNRRLLTSEVEVGSQSAIWCVAGFCVGFPFLVFGGCAAAALCGTSETRSEIRRKYRLREEPCGDCLVHSFCLCCAIAQEQRELRMRRHALEGDSAAIERALEEKERLREVAAEAAAAAAAVEQAPRAPTMSRSGALEEGASGRALSPTFLSGAYSTALSIKRLFTSTGGDAAPVSAAADMEPSPEVRQLQAGTPGAGAGTGRASRAETNKSQLSTAEGFVDHIKRARQGRDAGLSRVREPRKAFIQVESNYPIDEITRIKTAGRKLDEKEAERQMQHNMPLAVRASRALAMENAAKYVKGKQRKQLLDKAKKQAVKVSMSTDTVLALGSVWKAVSQEDNANVRAGEDGTKFLQDPRIGYAGPNQEFFVFLTPDEIAEIREKTRQEKTANRLTAQQAAEVDDALEAAEVQLGLGQKRQESAGNRLKNALRLHKKDSDDSSGDEDDMIEEEEELDAEIEATPGDGPARVRTADAGAS